jgi:stage V sporulation protein K
MEKLDKLVGLAEVKEQIRMIAAFAKMKKDMSENGNADVSVALNMGFVGNSGTARTTVARSSMKSDYSPTVN